MKKFKNEDVVELVVGTYQSKVFLSFHKKTRISTRRLLRAFANQKLLMNNENLAVLFPSAKICSRYKNMTMTELTKKWRREKFLVVAVSFLLLGMMMMYFLVGCTRTNNDLSDYPAKNEYLAAAAKVYMPALKELPPYESIKFEEKCENRGLFTSQSVQLVVQYDQQNYDVEKNRINKKYDFLTHPIKWEGEYTIPSPKFQIGDFNFRVVKTSKASILGYPKEIGFIATSDQKETIAYLFFFDTDLDFINKEPEGDGMIEFIKSNFSAFWN